MNTFLLGAFFGGWEIVLILAVVLILFGARKLPELAKGLGQGIKEFKKATRDVSEEIQTAMDDHSYTPPPPPRKIEEKSSAPASDAEKTPATPHSSEHKT